MLVNVRSGEPHAVFLAAPKVDDAHVNGFWDVALLV